MGQPISWFSVCSIAFSSGPEPPDYDAGALQNAKLVRCIANETAKSTPCGTRTRNLRIRSPTPCPLGQGGYVRMFMPTHHWICMDCPPFWILMFPQSIAVGLHAVMGDDARRQPRDLQDSMLHEITVAWMRELLKASCPARAPWQESREGHKRRLQEACRQVNAEQDVEGLCRENKCVKKQKGTTTPKKGSPTRLIAWAPEHKKSPRPKDVQTTRGRQAKPKEAASTQECETKEIKTNTSPTRLIL